MENQPTLKGRLFVQPSKWVRASLLATMTGLTTEAIRKKRTEGVWLQGKHWRKAPDDHYVYNWQEIDLWMEGRW